MLIKLLAAAALVPVVTACAALQASEQEKYIAPQQAAAIQAVCSKIMRLRGWQPEFVACVSSLSTSFAYQVIADYAADAYRDCAQIGLKRGTYRFSSCALDQENRERNARHLPSAATLLNTAYILPADSSPDDYFRTTNRMRRWRERYACAQLGLEPNSEPLATCVKNLDREIFETRFHNG